MLAQLPVTVSYSLAKSCLVGATLGSPEKARGSSGIPTILCPLKNLPVLCSRWLRRVAGRVTLTLSVSKDEHAVAISLGDGEGSTIGAEGD